MSTIAFTPKRCNCCGETIQTREEWEALPFVGTCEFPDETLEYRNHGCKSTLAISLTGIVPARVGTLEKT